MGFSNAGQNRQTSKIYVWRTAVAMVTKLQFKILDVRNNVYCFYYQQNFI